MVSPRTSDENAEIIMVERGPFVSYANCGLPYYVGGVIPRESETFLDVRHPQELAVEQAPGAFNIPLDELRDRLDELPRDREIHVICRSGQRAYNATRILRKMGSWPELSLAA